jgi:hypothetical protein
MKGNKLNNNTSSVRRIQIKYEEAEKALLSDFPAFTIIEVYRETEGEEPKFYPFSIQVISPSKATIRFELRRIELMPVFIAYSSLLRAGYIITKTRCPNLMEFTQDLLDGTIFPVTIISISCQTIAEVIAMGERLTKTVEELTVDVMRFFIGDILVVENCDIHLEPLDPEETSKVNEFMQKPN